MASNGDEVRRAAMKELARRELARRQQQPKAAEQPKPDYLSRVGSAVGNYAGALASKPWQAPRALAETLLSAGTGMVAGPVNDFFNSAMEFGGFPTKDVMSAYQPKSEVGQAALAAGNEIMSPVNAAVDSATGVNDPDNQIRGYGRAIRGTLGVLPLVGARALPKTAPRTAPVRAVPKTAAQLRTEANAAYSRANELGRGEIIKQDSLGNFTAKTERGLVDDAFDADLEPMTAKSMNILMEEATRPGIAGHTPQGLEIVRRKLLNAETLAGKAGNANDARMVGKIIDDFDEYADNLVQGQDVIGTGDTAASIAARTEARALWSRMKKTQTIENLIERAKDTSPALTQTGLENALRIQFKQLVLNERRMRQFSTEEQAAIRKVARGGVAQQVARRVASLAPRGTVSGMGSAVLGGATGAGAVPFIVAGEAGALAAKLMRLSDVEAARTLISTGQSAAPAARPALANPTAGAVRASNVIPPALATQEVERQRRNYLQSQEIPRNSLAR
jgi:hypothetical protein